jgi:hypothetical protein
MNVLVAIVCILLTAPLIWLYHSKRVKDGSALYHVVDGAILLCIYAAFKSLFPWFLDDQDASAGEIALIFVSTLGWFLAKHSLKPKSR